MTKLQAAMAKIRTKARPAPAHADKLYLPAQKAQDDSFLPIDASAIKKWLIAQNAVNSPASRSTYATEAETLLKTLRHSNRIICTPADRLQIMEVYEKPFVRSMQSLDSRYLYLDFPLQKDANNAFQLAATLCQEMAFGYKIAIANTFTHQSTDRKFALVNEVVNQKASRARRCSAIKSAYKYLTHLALRHTQINHDWPDELWQDLNVLMHIATEDRSHKVTDQTNVDPQLTIEQQYASLCALTILDQNKLSAEDVRSLFLTIRKHSSTITFHNSVESAKSAEQNTANEQDHASNSSQDIYSTGIDRPPELFESTYRNSDEKLMHFSLSALLEKLHADDYTGTPHEVSSGCKRNQSRVERSMVMTAETGLQEIHTQIRLTPPSENTASQFTNLNHLLSSKSDDSFVRQDAFNQTNVLDQSGIQECSSSFEVENESPGGFGLKWTGEGVCRAQVGELLAHCYQHSGFQDGKHRDKDDQDLNHSQEISWHLSVVRWLRTDTDGSLRLGVESLSRHTKAVSIKRLMKSNKSSHSIVEGLLINYQPIDSKAEMLILPRQHYKAGETLACRDDKNIHTVQLVEGVDISSSYQCFAIRKVEAEILPGSASEADQYQVAV